MKTKNSRSTYAFIIFTILVTMILPLLCTIWPLSDVLEFIAFRANLFIIVPLAYWMIRLMIDESQKYGRVKLAIAICAMVVAAYLLKTENLFMHSKFEPLDAWERFRQYASFSAFAYACIFVVIGSLNLWSRTRPLS